MSNDMQNSEQRPFLGRVLNIIGYFLIVIPAIVLSVGFYFRLSRQGKRKFWVIIIAILILGWVWDILLESPLFNSVEVDNYENYD